VRTASDGNPGIGVEGEIIPEDENEEVMTSVSVRVLFTVARK